jgi:hypothetical protein
MTAANCARCGAPAPVVMSFNYDEMTMWLDDLVEPITPGAGYALCDGHAGRRTPPVGWTLIDRRRERRSQVASLEVA